MQRKHLVSASAITLVAACSLAAQEAASIAALEFQKPKNGMIQQYEAGRKQKAAWHKQQNDPQPLLVWEVLSGDNTGIYVVGRFGWHWADFDKPAIPDESDKAEFDKVVGNYVDSVIARYYEFLPKISRRPPDSKTPAKFSEIVTFHLRYGKSSDFRSAIARVSEAAEKTKWPVNYEWYGLANGGPAGEYVLAIPHENWADFQDKPDVKPLPDMVKEAFGQAEADSIVDRIDASVERETTEIVQFHPELSYLPSK
jgi:hypothetical protein